jgi:hypothetical protein
MGQVEKTTIRAILHTIQKSKCPIDQISNVKNVTTQVQPSCRKIFSYYGLTHRCNKRLINLNA